MKKEIYKGAKVSIPDNWTFEGSWDDEDKMFYGRFDCIDSDKAVAYIEVNQYGGIMSTTNSEGIVTNHQGSDFVKLS